MEEPAAETTASALAIGARCTAPSLSASGNFTCVVRPSGAVACWGANGVRQLGTATPAFLTSPADVPGITGAVAVTTGGSHACALLEDGTVRCWGGNSSGQLGNGSVVRSSAPVAVSGLTGITSISAGSTHTCALRNDGTVWCWGSNGSGRLGDGTTARRTTPVQVSGLSDVRAIAAGGSHTCALTSAGSAFCWGANSYGQLGDGTRSTRTRPVAVSPGTPRVWRSLSAGGSHTCGVLQQTGNGVLCWGRSSQGQLGDATTTTYRATPAPAFDVAGAALADGVMVAAGSSSTCLIRGGGSAACWGSNGYGQLGDGTLATPRRSAVEVAAPPGLANGFLLASSGSAHTCAISVTGDVYCWGSNAYGQLGDSTRTRRTTPVRSGTASGLTFAVFLAEDEVSAAHGASASALVAAGDVLYAAGVEHGATADAWVVRRSRDRGANWTRVDSFSFGSGGDLAEPHLAHLANGNLLLAGAAHDDDGNVVWVVRRSSDEGDSWATVDTFMLDRGRAATVRRIAEDAAGRVYVAGSADDASGTRWLLRASGDGGTTWFVADDLAGSAETHGLLDAGSAGLFAVGHVTSGGTAHLRVRQTATVVASDRGTTWTDADDFQDAAGYDTIGEAIASDLTGRIFVLARANGPSGWSMVLRGSTNGANWQTISRFQLEPGQDTHSFGLLVDRAGTLHVVGAAARAGASARGLVASSYDHGATWRLADELGAASALTDLAEDSTGAIHVAGALGSGAAAHWTVRSRACHGLVPSCGNWVIDPGELCDGTCSDCNDHDACTTDGMHGSPLTCDVTCTNTPITACTSGDGCCPAGCTSDQDLDCCLGPLDNGVCLDMSFELTDLAATGCTTFEHSATTGSGRGALAVSSTSVFYTGSGPTNRGATGRFSATDFSGGRATTYDWEQMFSDLRTGTVYILGSGSTPLGASGGTATTLIPLDPSTGARTTPRITLSQSIRIASNRAFFSGYGRVIIHNGAHAFDVWLPSGQVRDLGAMTMPSHNTCVTSGAWGLAESFGGALYIDYADGAEVHRTRVPDGVTTTLEGFTNLGNTCTLGLSIGEKHWYFQHAGASQFGSGTQLLGRCEARFRRPNAPSVCGDGILEATETCDGDCPTACDDGVACTADRLVGAPASCNVACTHQPVAACVRGDGCCPAGCNAINDDDCATVCGNGVVEAGEACDGDCPTSCNDGNTCTTDALTGSASSCSATCSHAPVTTCATGDGCCPSGCTETNDRDCAPSCGNGVVEAGETCDGDCPTACSDGNACTTDTLTGSASACNVACTHVAVSTCLNGDGCCPALCNANNDGDCHPTCGNGVVEAGEACDGNCPTSCSDGDACTTDVLAGSPSLCNVGCTHGAITACANGDGCCPAGCNGAEDHDCAHTCGNGVVEPGETCDGDCPTSCDDGVACTTDTLVGSALTCNAACTHTGVTACTTGDGCCPTGCSSNSDGDCAPTCGNGVVEAGEACDGNCPTSCSDGNSCTTDALTGSAATCDAACTHAALTTCASGDGCCPSGCNTLQDSDCPAVCGNWVVEPGELCDGNCPTSCSDGSSCTTDTLTGSAATCNAACTHASTACCTPVSCAEVCGTFGDGCGGTLDCGTCITPVLTAGTQFGCLVRANGTVKCWGLNTSGQLGDGTTTSRSWPELVSGVSGATSVAAGASHACARLSNGTVRCWGLNTSGQLGDGTTTNRSTPVTVTGITTASAIAAGAAHTCALLADGTVRCWGANTTYQLGDGTTTTRSSPVAVSGVGGATAVTAGSGHSCALLGSGSAVCWGSSSAGQLGDGFTTTRSAPVAVSGLSTITQLKAGYYGDYTCALLATGVVRCWGYNAHGELGDGTTTNRSTPVAVSGLAGGVTSITAGQIHTCARLSDGTARCWGYNGTYALGDGTPTNRTSPVSVTGLPSSVTSVAAGYRHTCALLDDGSLRCWGQNTSGELGDESVVARTTIVTVAGVPCALGTSNSCTSCVPTTCAAEGATNTTISDGCGGTLYCGGTEPRLAASLESTCAVAPNGAVKCWGDNSYGQLGNGTTTPSYEPAAVVGITTAVAVAVGETHACALLADRTIWCWGNDVYGQLGDGSTTQRTLPIQVSTISTAIGVTAGRNHTCARLADGTARCWGLNSYGQLGDGTGTQRTTPVSPLGLTQVVAIAGGSNHTCALLATGVVRCFGHGASGQLGNGATSTYTPVHVPTITTAIGLAASPASDHTCAVLSSGGVRCWGSNTSGQLGDGTTTTRTTPVSVVGVSTAVSASAGATHTCARLADGALVCWGDNTSGQLGDGTTTQRTTPVTAGTPLGASFVSAGSGYTCAVLVDGTTDCWGDNTYGQLGDGSVLSRTTPGAVYAFPCQPTSCAAGGVAVGNMSNGCGSTIFCGEPLARISAGSGFSCVVKSDGRVGCWGSNNLGQLGDGTMTNRSWQENVTGLSGATTVAAGYQHACALLSNGTVRCWGYNASGQLGDGTTTTRTSPVAVSGLSNAVALSAGLNHTCARLADGTMKCWGFNASGQVGDGTTTSRNTPVAVAALSPYAGVIAVAAGNNYSCALLSGGTVRCWGDNASGQLGDGTTTAHTSPVTVVGLGRAVAVAASGRGSHTCALLASGAVSCWGSNANGQLGDGTTTTRSTAAAVTGISTAVEITAGSNHSCARLADGTARCWGYNGTYTLGDGTNTNRTSPVAVSGVGGVASISAGYRHSCALLNDGTARCWGQNTTGELGDESTVARTSPVVVAGFPCALGTSNSCTTCVPTSCAAQGQTTGSIADGCGGTLYCGSAEPRLAASAQNACALTASGGVRCWGNNDHGQLGIGSTAPSFEPAPVTGITTAVAVAVGELHACAVLADHTVRCWGDATYNQLGDGTTTQANAPVAVLGINNAVGVVAGRYHTCARLSDGTARCWGANNFGQLGDASMTQRSTPISPLGLTQVAQLSAGLNHTCALLTTGVVRCWGYNTYSEVGNGVASAIVPMHVPGITTAVAVAAASQGEHTCALLASGTVSCWGYNATGQVGDGTTATRATPVAVPGVSTAIALAAGAAHTCALLSGGGVSCWGDNSAGELGDGTTTQRASPTPVTGLGTATGLAAGVNFTCASLVSGGVSCWGSNDGGQLGDRTVIARSTPGAVYAVPCTPTTCSTGGVTTGSMQNGCGQSVYCGAERPEIEAGSQFSCLVRADGGVACWGLNSSGQLGDGTTFNRYWPDSVSGVTGAVAVAAGQQHACALLAGGTIRCWGYNGYGQLGDGTTTQRTSPVTVSGLTNAVGLTAGQYHTCARLADGTARCWGYNASYQLGDGTTTTRTTPVAVQNLVGYGDIIQLTAGNSHTCALVFGGTVRCWGEDASGQLGDGGTTARATPATVAGLGNVIDLRAARRGDFTCALSTDGIVRCWGQNGNGQLGDGTTTTRGTPAQVTGISTAVQISAGNLHACARLADGTARCWGYGGTYNLGDGAGSSRLTPVAVSGLSNVAEISAGFRHTCALLADGTARCWGTNSSGELGDESNVTRTTIQTVAGYPCPLGTSNACTACVPTTCAAQGFTNGTLADGCGGALFCGSAEPRLSVSGQLACAIRSGGVWCWGANDYGQLGDGASSPSYQPAPVTGISTAVSVVTGDTHACALLADGTVRCWGNNTNGQLGDGTVNNALAPVLVSGISTAIGLAAGQGHTCARLADGTARCWGLNTNGQLGDGSLTERHTAVSPLGLTGVVGLTAGLGHTCALLANGTVRCFGLNTYGELGNGTTTARVPMHVPTITSAIAISTASLGEHTCAVLSSGAVSCWGLNTSGQLGDGTSTNRSTPVSVPGLTTAVSVKAGVDHTCALLSSGAVRCWGDNTAGELGDGTNTQRLTPVAPSGLSGSATALASGSSFTCALLADGTIACWGNNDGGQLGDGTVLARSTPAPVYAFPCLPTSCSAGGVAVGSMADGCGSTVFCGPARDQIAAGSSFSCVVRASGAVACWGLNTSGQLGDGTSLNHYWPADVSGVSGATTVVTGQLHACALLGGGTVQCWGSNTYGQLGDGTNTSRTVPVTVSGLTSAVGLTAGQYHTCARLGDGTVRCWGHNAYNQLGDGTTTNRTTPVAVQNLSPYGDVIAVSAGANHTCALDFGGTVRCWGNDNAGQLGDGGTTARAYPFTVAGVGNVISLAAATRGDFTCATSTDGLVRCWGSNGNGQLGDGTTTDRGTAAPVSGITTAVEVSAGNIHACARLADGTLRCWGYGGTYNLGDGTASSRTTPVAVSGVTGAVDVSAGFRHSCALLADGTARCWGQNTSGELGDETNVARTTVVTVGSFPCQAGTSNACTTCVPTTCAAQGATSGTISDGCGGTLFCGSAEPRLAASSQLTCDVLSNGTVKCWGANASGQLGNGTTTASFEPVQVTGISTAVAVGVGASHACALLANGTVSCWGANGNGQLGDGTTTSRSTPAPVTGITTAIGLAAGQLHTCARLADGTARCWGYNTSGQLGDGTLTQRTTPVSPVGLSGVVGLSAGVAYTCALLSTGTVQCFGGNTNGQLGNGTTDARIPMHVPMIASAVSISVSPLGDHTCALLADGTARCWGNNTNGQSGDGTTVHQRPTPVTVAGLSGITQVKAGDNHTCAVVSGGGVRCWGANTYGELGDGTTTQRTTPVTPTGLTSGVSEVATGSAYTCVRLSNETVQCFGLNDAGQLGDGSVVSRTTPTAVYGLTCQPTSCSAAGVYAGSMANGCGQTIYCGEALEAIAASFSFSCGLRANGTVSCWGSNSNGQLGDGTTTQQPTGVTVSGVTGATTVATGQLHACALLSDRTVRCWGYNAYGQLGDGTTTQRTTPVTVSGLTNAVGISAGLSHTCARLADGTARCWGYNATGQLGDGTTTNRSTPTPVSGLSAQAGVIAVSCGQSHTCALLSGGAIRCWGANTSGQLGDGTTTQSLTPVTVAGVGGVVDLAAASLGDFSCALSSDGTVSCWGLNGNGQLGDGTTTTRSTAALVAGITTATQLSASSLHACARLSDGTGRCWGYGGTYNLGDGTATSRTTPVAVSGLTTATTIAAGYRHTCAKLADGTARCWGRNTSGELGDGTTTARTSLVTVLGLP